MLTVWNRAFAVVAVSFTMSGAFAENMASASNEHPQSEKRAKQRLVETFSVDELSELKASLVLVEGGDFMMGSDSETASAREKPAHQVSLSNFYMGKTEVTQALFERVMGWNVSYFACPTCPVNNISWMNVHLFVTRLNAATGLSFSLPTEAQWEYAAKGGQKSKGYKFSGSDDINSVAWFADNAKRKSYPVATKLPNELGLFDMTGNLWEFCLDDMSRKTYQHDRKKDPVLISNSDPKAVSMKVIRGGGYEFSASESEIFKRDGMTSNVRMPDVGFRLAHPATEKLL